MKHLLWYIEIKLEGKPSDYFDWMPSKLSCILIISLGNIEYNYPKSNCVINPRQYLLFRSSLAVLN